MKKLLKNEKNKSKNVNMIKIQRPEPDSPIFIIQILFKY